MTLQQYYCHDSIVIDFTVIVPNLVWCYLIAKLGAVEPGVHVLRVSNGSRPPERSQGGPSVNPTRAHADGGVVLVPIYLFGYSQVSKHYSCLFMFLIVSSILTQVGFSLFLP